MYTYQTNINPNPLLIFSVFTLSQYLVFNIRHYQFQQFKGVYNLTMESQMNNRNNSNFNPQHAKTVIPSHAVSFQNCQTNQITPFGPQGLQSQFAGHVSPIPNQQQLQQQQTDIILDTMRVMSQIRTSIHQT